MSMFEKLTSSLKQRV